MDIMGGVLLKLIHKVALNSNNRDWGRGSLIKVWGYSMRAFYNVALMYGAYFSDLLNKSWELQL